MNDVLKMEDSNNQELCLKWNNFSHNFMSQFETLREDEDFVDVTLYCCGKCIKAHKVILSACSPYLKNIFKEHPCKHPIVILDNLSFNDLDAVVQFVYTGQVYIQEAELSSFLQAAKMLQITGLTESNSQNLVEVCIKEGDAFPIKKSRDKICHLKWEIDAEMETKRLRNKKVFKRISHSAAEENNEFFETKRRKEKDWCVSNDSRVTSKNEFEGNEGNFRDSNLHFDIVERTSENEDKILNTSGAEEEYFSDELKRPHWLDPRSCPMCNRTYSNLSNLRQHMKLIHNPTFVTCELCKKTFKTDLYLRRHISSYHELDSSGNANSTPSVEPFIESLHNQPSDWNTVVKLEPHSFQEVFSSSEMYQVPQ